MQKKISTFRPEAARENISVFIQYKGTTNHRICCFILFSCSMYVILYFCTCKRPHDRLCRCANEGNATNTAYTIDY